ncbi:hypothetical protein BN2497_6765 [Janthinobacterium sp. CG23_2]|nr:hypothetical protein BN2497_6765 [Janthinobacterium sp. CG23_2]CUU29780.1 hypothetical protein BN3177_6765 [Janthinobacterium sp. CG23_2]
MNVVSTRAVPSHADWIKQTVCAPPKEKRPSRGRSYCLETRCFKG